MKKDWKSIAIFIIISGVLIMYLWPHPLSGLIHEDSFLAFNVQEFSVIETGEPYIDSKDYSYLDNNKIARIHDLFKEYSYHRSVKTIFSDGTISPIKNTLILMYIYEDGVVQDVVSITSDYIAFKGKTYTFWKGDRFTERLLEILQN